MKVTKKVNVVVKQEEENPISVEILAKEILEISNAMKAISKSRLKRDAIVVLIQAKSKLYKSQIELVLNNLEQLESEWLK